MGHRNHIRLTPARYVAACLAALAATTIGLTSAPTTAAACGISEGTSSASAPGTRVGSNPVRFEFADSPYLGVQYDSCRNVLSAYYGGYTGITHYNLRYDGGGPYIDPPAKQIEVGPGPARKWSLGAAPFQSADGRGYLRVSFAVQACKRGSGPFSTSKCTRWSPLVGVPAGPRGS